MQWSRYNVKFQSKHGGFLLYNSGAGSLIHIDEITGAMVDQIATNPDIDFSRHPELFFNLRLGGFLVDNGADDNLVRVMKMRRLAASYSDRQLLLTIAPTRDCNFACEYCYEQNRTYSEMPKAVEDSIVAFIKKHKAIEKIYITWYGGEPLMAFEKILRLNEKISSIGIDCESHIVTNGYFLSSEIICALDVLKATSMQITIDGVKKTHDTRRCLKNGGATYDVIMRNIDTLLSSSWGGRLNIRVNVDNQNKDEFMAVHKHINQTYRNEHKNHLYVYPGFVNNPECAEQSKYLTSKDKSSFLLDIAQNAGVNPLSLFPHMTLGGCTMTKKNAYVIGPDGELYKCWRDLGNKDFIVGNVDGTAGNTSLIAEGMIDSSYVHCATCENCKMFPVCDGGCSKIRMLNNRGNHAGDFCSYFKHNLHDLLDIHYRQKLSMC